MNLSKIAAGLAFSFCFISNFSSAQVNEESLLNKIQAQSNSDIKPENMIDINIPLLDGEPIPEKKLITLRH